MVVLVWRDLVERVQNGGSPGRVRDRVMLCPYFFLDLHLLYTAYYLVHERCVHSIIQVICPSIGRMLDGDHGNVSLVMLCPYSPALAYCVSKVFWYRARL